MEYLPVFLSLRGRTAVVVGGGAVALRKSELLLKCGARVRVVAPELTESLRALLSGAPAQVQHLRERFSPDHLHGAVLAIAATDCAQSNAEVGAAARELNIPVNVVDDAAQSSFILPAIVDRSPVVLAVGTSGNAPVLARGLRARLEALLPARMGELARFAGARRRRVQQTLHARARRPFWERLFAGPIATHVLSGDVAAAESLFERELAVHGRGAASTAGEVYLIGAGPGDPDLLTLRALQLLQQCDAVLYDRLVPPAVLELARREAERVFVGKHAGGCRMAQQEINERLVAYARRGLKVARLKGGDPFIFGRGGEEIRELIRHGVAVTVVPGITAGLAAAAAAGIALTQRELSQSVTFATGHFADDDALDWHALARPRQTVVFYMAVSQLENITARLIGAGAPPERPVALIERASLPQQRIVRGRLGEIAGRARAQEVRPPALLIIGEVTAALESATIETFGAALQGAA